MKHSLFHLPSYLWIEMREIKETNGWENIPKMLLLIPSYTRVSGMWKIHLICIQAGFNAFFNLLSALMRLIAYL